MNKNIKMLVAISLTSSVFAMNLGTSFAQDIDLNQLGGSYAPQLKQQTLQGHVVIIPAGTNIAATTTRTISSDKYTIGDSVTLNLGSPFFFQGKIIAPANSIINGSVVISEPAGRGGKHGKLKIKFTDIVTPYGYRIPIAGKIQTEDGTGVLIGGTNKDRAKKAAKNTAIGAAGGALSGLIFGSASGGKAGKGAAVGTAIGGGLGLGKSLWEKGNDAQISSGSIVDIVIDQPITINPAAQ